LQAWRNTISPSPSTVLIEPNARPGLGQDHFERGLAALKGITPQVVAVQLDQVKGVEEYDMVGAVVPDEIERGEPVTA
jgi:hypothetical protein